MHIDRQGRSHASTQDTQVFSRRAAIVGAVTLAAAPVALPALAAPVTVDPIVDMQRTAMALVAHANHPDTDGEISDEECAKALGLQHEAFDTTVTTSAGALASLLWGQAEFKRYYIDERGDEADWMDHFTLKMIDNAIAVLRKDVACV